MEQNLSFISCLPLHVNNYRLIISLRVFILVHPYPFHLMGYKSVLQSRKVSEMEMTFAVSVFLTSSLRIAVCSNEEAAWRSSWKRESF